MSITVMMVKITFGLVVIAVNLVGFIWSLTELLTGQRSYINGVSGLQYSTVVVILGIVLGVFNALMVDDE